MKENIPYIAPLILNAFRYFFFAGIAFFIFYLFFPNTFSNNKIQRRLAKNKDFLREIFHSVQTTFVIAAVIVIFLKTPLKEYTLVYKNVSDFPIWWLPLSVILALILHDTYFYWMHRAVHHPKIFKHVHVTHHKSTNPSPWAAYSFHITEAILEALIGPILMLLLPIHKWGLLAFSTASLFINVYGHLGYEIAPKWMRRTLLFEILNTSTHHNMHHAKFKGNYGLYFRFWDRIMGTEFPTYVEQYDKIQEKRLQKSATIKMPPTKKQTTAYPSQ